nr:serine/threonine-protein phosphatase 6 regulatory ankyrin repeat subunit B [Parasteatoda tepidariorum]
MLAFEEKARIFFDAVFSFEGLFDADFLMKLLFKNANPNYVISDDVLWSSKLHVAVLSKDCSLALVQSILAEDSSQLNQKNIFQVTPLHRAVYCAKNLDIVIELLKQGANVNAVERSMMSALHIAAYNSNQYQYDLLEILIEFGGNVNCVDYKNQTPLHMLVKNRYVQEQSVCLLLQKGADPNACDNYSDSILKVAIQNTYISLNIIKTLLVFGANPEEHLKYCIQNLPLAKLLIQHIASSNARIRDINKNRSLFEDALLSMKYDKFSYCSDLIDAAFEFHDVLNILSEHGLYAVQSMKSLEHKRIYLNYYAITDLASYVTKKDLINLALAYINENYHRDVTKRKLFTSKSTKRLHDGLSDSMLCMKRLKL